MIDLSTKFRFLHLTEMAVGEFLRQAMDLAGAVKLRVLDLCAAPGGKTTDSRAESGRVVVTRPETSASEAVSIKMQLYK